MTLNEALSKVLEFFEGNLTKFAEWYCTDNPGLGGISPHQMRMIGREEKLIRFIKGQLEGNTP